MNAALQIFVPFRRRTRLLHSDSRLSPSAGEQHLRSPAG